MLKDKHNCGNRKGQSSNPGSLCRSKMAEMLQAQEHMLTDRENNSRVPLITVTNTTLSSGELPRVARLLVWLAIHFILVHLLIAVECIKVTIAPATFPLAGTRTLTAMHL